MPQPVDSAMGTQITHICARREQSRQVLVGAQMPRDAVDEAVAVMGRQARRSDRKLPPHVMIYFAMPMFSDDNSEEVAARLAGALTWRVAGTIRGACRPRTPLPWT